LELMTHQLADEKQYVVVAAGEHGKETFANR
jgi:hypothetical protein